MGCWISIHTGAFIEIGGWIGRHPSENQQSLERGRPKTCRRQFQRFVHEGAGQVSSTGSPKCSRSAIVSDQSAWWTRRLQNQCIPIDIWGTQKSEGGWLKWIYLYLCQKRLDRDDIVLPGITWSSSKAICTHLIWGNRHRGLDNLHLMTARTPWSRSFSKAVTYCLLSSSRIMKPQYNHCTYSIGQIMSCRFTWNSNNALLKYWIYGCKPS